MKDLEWLEKEAGWALPVEKNSNLNIVYMVIGKVVKDKSKIKLDYDVGFRNII